jgi:hypothetical protein
MIELAAAPQPKVPREQLAMPGTKFHHRIPILGRSFLQRNEVRLQRDQALQELARAQSPKR